MKIWSIAKHAFMTFWYPYVRTLNSIWPSKPFKANDWSFFPTSISRGERVCLRRLLPRRRPDAGPRLRSGVGAVFCAPKVRELVAVDISSSAVKNTEENCRLNGLNNVAVKQSDMFSSVEGKFDLILANPPYIEAEFENEGKQFATSVRYLPTLFSRSASTLRTMAGCLFNSRSGFAGGSKTCVRARPEVGGGAPPAAEVSGLFLLSLLYMQVGFRSAFYLLQPMPNKGAALPR